MRPDRNQISSLLLACIGELAGMVPYIVVALLAAGLAEGRSLSQLLSYQPPAAAQVLKFPVHLALFHDEPRDR